MRLGRVRGIRVAAHWSVVGIVAVIAWVTARLELPVLAPGHGALAEAVAGVAVALLLVASLLAHEIAHALVARAAGIEVEGITLWLLGGTTRMDGEPDRPATALRVAAVGPLVSAALAGLFALAAVLARTSASGLVVAVLAELALLNLVLAAFNLLPAAPLDGGRILGAALWALRGDRWGAAIASARTGRVLGALLVGVGVYLALLVDLGGAWLALVGWFVGASAGQEERRARQGRALDGLTVAAAAGPAPAVLLEDATPAEPAAAATSPRSAAGVPLLTAPDGSAAGYLPAERLRRLPTRAGGDGRVPASSLTTVRPDDPLTGLLGRLADTGARLVVVDGAGAPVGIVGRAGVEELLLPGRPTDAGPADRAGAGVPTDPGAPPPADWWWHGGPTPPDARADRDPSASA
ncbi:site-2 protease family protein [Actinomycetospora chlora]|uniref:site-2 protease family protein n=1 Tax=Actinomycetospora chlora TaxID=663608 RepID=UPI0031F0299E